MIAFGSCIVDPGAYIAYARPGIQAARSPEPTVFAFEAVGNVSRSNNLLLDAAGPIEDLEALVLVEEHVELLEPEMCVALRTAFADPDVAVVGCMGASNVRTIAWWEGRLCRGDVRQRHHDHGGGELTRLGWAPVDRPPQTVDTVDGRFLALSPWAARTLRFDEELSLGFGDDLDFCLQARQSPSQGRGRADPRGRASAARARPGPGGLGRGPHPLRGEVGRPDARRRADRGLEGPRAPRRGRARRRAHAGLLEHFDRRRPARAARARAGRAHDQPVVADHPPAAGAEPPAEGSLVAEHAADLLARDHRRLGRDARAAPEPGEPLGDAECARLQEPAQQRLLASPPLAFRRQLAQRHVAVREVVHAVGLESLQHGVAVERVEDRRQRRRVGRVQRPSTPKPKNAGTTARRTSPRAAAKSSTEVRSRPRGSPVRGQARVREPAGMQSGVAGEQAAGIAGHGMAMLRGDGVRVEVVVAAAVRPAHVVEQQQGEIEDALAIGVLVKNSRRTYASSAAGAWRDLAA